LIVHERDGLLISPGSAATYVGCGGQCYMNFVANFITFLAVKQF